MLYGVNPSAVVTILLVIPVNKCSPKSTVAPALPVPVNVSKPLELQLAPVIKLLLELIVNLSAFVLVTEVAPPPTNSISSVPEPEPPAVNLSFVVAEGILTL